MSDTQMILLIAMGAVVLIWIMIWVPRYQERGGKLEAYSTRNYTNANDWTADRPYPMYSSFLDHEGDYKYIDEYVQALRGDPFKHFPPTDNYTTRLMSYLRSPST